ncbi:hypothetical protein LTS18_003477 [Coniosporium uncinatum]|uniref:Uncharacterized protein n=1 Tax=Coniosporium uncinatum TaxID=93489 RepID=A0ACC3DTA8_9PEZI|nr:hypothetical protein LTS18_003477 [Coniosporium uncinatum]
MAPSPDFEGFELEMHEAAALIGSWTPQTPIVRSLTTSPQTDDGLTAPAMNRPSGDRRSHWGPTSTYAKTSVKRAARSDSSDDSRKKSDGSNDDRLSSGGGLRSALDMATFEKITKKPEGMRLDMLPDLRHC